MGQVTISVYGRSEVCFKGWERKKKEKEEKEGEMGRGLIDFLRGVSEII